MALRRWRLWWRFQLRVLPRRGPLRRARVLRSTDEDAPLRREQLAAGRLLGRSYLALTRGRERTRIERSRAPERVRPLRTMLELLKRQRALLTSLIALIVIGSLLDVLAREVGPEVAHALGIERWLRATFTRPSAETLRIVLAAAAGGTATILGLVLSISLIAWQATADRYRSTSIVAFLLRERLGSAVVKMLALGFAYSLWVLALFEVSGHRPYASTALAVGLSTAAVLSLISYRESALLGYLPVNIARSLKEEIVTELERARRRGAGRSVENRSRIILAADVQIFADLIARLLAEGDPVDLTACLGALGDALAYYALVKPSFPPDSMIFERRKARLGRGGESIEESILSKGLMNPTSDVPDHLWFERRVMELTQTVADSAALSRSEVAETLFGLWATALQYSWYLEDPDALELILAELERFAQDPRVRESQELAGALTNTLWLTVEAVGKGFATTSEAIVNSEPWKNARTTELPWLAREDARELARQVRGEILITGGLVSPRWAMVAEVQRIRGPRLAERQRELIARTVSICLTQLRQVSPDDALGAPTLARMTMRILLRILHHGLMLPDTGDLAPLLMRASYLAEGEEAEDIRSEASRGARVFAGAQEWNAADALLAVAANSARIAISREPDEQRKLIISFDSLFTVAAVYGWGEFHQRPDRLAAAARYIAAPYTNIDALAGLIEQHGLFRLMLPVLTYAGWFGPLKQAVAGLPDRQVFDGGIGYSLEKDHPSQLIARADIMFGPAECLAHLVEALLAEREELRPRLLAALDGVLRTREVE